MTSISSAVPGPSVPLVSVLVTVHNRERYLAACLDSVLASSCQDFEIIVVDDHSSDGSPAVAERYGAADPRLKFFRNGTNLGDYPNRMRAAELARGRYIKYVDSDDLIYPHALALMAEAMEAHPDAALGLSQLKPEAENPYPWKLEPLEAWRRQFLGEGGLGCGPTGAIMHRERFFEAGGFGSWGVLSDIDLWYRMSARWPVLFLPPGLVWWRRHDEQEFTRDGAAGRYLSDGYRLEIEALSSSESPLSDSETRSAMERARQHHARRLLALSLRGRPRDGWRLFRKSGLGASDLLSGLLPYT